MPTFAFMNAGVAVTGAAAWASSLSAGIFVGLVIGKPLGILLGLWIGKRLGIADLPQRLTWSHIGGIGMLGGIGFTMSLFVATLSFGDGSPALDVAKQGIIGASLVAGLVGFAWLRWVACTDGAQSTVTGR
jgi:NhaA family Na+:H+ antiporter